ncbi:MAG: N-acetylmuramoyl-L-alanine amidase [Ignavibacteriales bacterium]|nr:N-acetylmuramoyl-L-alanine amidase [Ignavibacteriales bacterium]
MPRALTLLSICLLWGYLSALQGQTSPPLRVIVPESDTNAAGSTQRISGCTQPDARVTANGKELHVYPTGAFGGAVDVPAGTSTLEIATVLPRSEKTSQTFVLIRPMPAVPSPVDPLTIEKTGMEPAQNRWLGMGDVLEVKFKGSPGFEAWFDIEGVESGIPMIEVQSKNGEPGGIYTGRYAVRPSDETRDALIVFHLKRSFWTREKAYSKGKVSFLPRELPRVGEITGRRPYLNAGLGTDRLGGAKLGFLQSGIRILVSGKVGNMYRVQLADGIEAWIDQDFVTLLPPTQAHPQSFVGSISAVGNEKEDVISVALDQRLPFLCEQTIDPLGLTVDLFGATSNTNWITRHLSAAGIKSITWSQLGKEHYRLTILSTLKQHWGYDVRYENGTNLRISMRRPPRLAQTGSPLKDITIGIDAGHGGDGNGALGSTGSKEKDMNLSIVHSLDSVLQARGARVVLTRKSDPDVGMGARLDTLLVNNVQIFVSVHCNSTGLTSDPTQIRGTSTYTRYAGYQTLSSTLYKKMLELDLEQWGITNSFNFSLNGPTQFPNTLVETAFMSNPEDEMLLLDPAFRARAAVKIADGLEVFLLATAEK